MQFDDLDKKIQEAAERFHPVYDEQAWHKMEALLNRELPQKHTRRKTVLWLTLFISIIVLGGAILLQHPLQRPKQPIQTLTEMPTSLLGKNHDSIKKENAGKAFANGAVSTGAIKNAFHATTLLALSNRKMFLQKSLYTRSGNSNKIDEGQEIGLPSTTTPVGDGLNAISKFPDGLNHEAFSIAMLQRQPVITSPVIENQNVGKSKNVASGVQKQAISNNDENTKLKENRIDNPLSLNVSAGADVSAVNIGNIGRINPVFGATIGYNINRKWNLRAGFYKVKKVYKAEASDYHPPSEFWADYPFLERIDARCTVIEIPFVVNYTFKKTVTAGYFGAVGLSSYIMKQETYHYISERPGQSYQSDIDSYTNQNKHYLSSLRLSFGYAKKVNSRISVTTEPYLNLPLSGIGFGKVKLNSGGVLLTLGIKPFGK
jgi:hypothetical protein